ncbi:MAG: transglycosylase SLT domain-containing protein [bacterium]
MKKIFISTSIVALINLAFLVRNNPAEIYHFVDNEGVIHYSNYPPDLNSHQASDKTKERAKKEIQQQKPPAKKLSSQPNHSTKDKIHELVNVVSNKYDVDPDLIKSIIEVESNYNPNATSRKGAKGLMQLMPATCELYGIKDPTKIEDNLEGGIKYFRYLYDRFDGDVDLALAAYNAGPKRVEDYKGIPPYRETKNYLKKVRKQLTRYKRSKKTAGSNKQNIYKYIDNEGVIHYTNILP